MFYYTVMSQGSRSKNYEGILFIILWSVEICENNVFEQVFYVFQAGINDRLCGKTNKKNFVFYMDFVFVLII